MHRSQWEQVQGGSGTVRLAQGAWRKACGGREAGRTSWSVAEPLCLLWGVHPQVIQVPAVRPATKDPEVAIESYGPMLLTCLGPGARDGWA